VLAASAPMPAHAGLPVDGRPTRAGLVKSGTGFFVSRDGLLLTSAHVVTGCHDISVWGEDGAQRRARILRKDATRDIALLASGGRSPRYYPILGPGRAPVGEEVYTLGFGVYPAEPLKPLVTAGNFVGDSRAPRGNRILVIRARLHAGNSGGAVVDARGSLLGMVIGREQTWPEFGVLVPRSDLAPMVSAHAVAGEPAGSGRKPGEAAQDLLRAISALIQCVPDR
jgi:S1-C subfamily serine protease